MRGRELAIRLTQSAPALSLAARGDDPRPQEVPDMPTVTYEPAMIQALRIKGTDRGLWMLYAADGMVLDAVETSDGRRPAWADRCIRQGEVAQLVTIDVTPSVWRTFRDDYKAQVAS